MRRARVVVEVRSGDDINFALRRLKRLVANTGLAREIRAREHYVKPGEVLRIKSRRARARVRRNNRRAASFDFDGPVQGSSALRRMPPSPRI